MPGNVACESGKAVHVTIYPSGMCVGLLAGHILRKVYNCREQKNFRPPNILKFPVKKIFHFLKISNDFFSHLQKNFSISLIFPFHPPKILMTFFVVSSFLMFQPFQTLHVQLHNQLFASFILNISRFSPFFSTLFPQFSSSKFTTTTAQFSFYNCKLHFTTAQIVISCTLKYALVPGVKPW